MARGKIFLSPDEIIAVLRNSSLPTVIVEGSDDIIIFRRLEQIYRRNFVSVLHAGGREAILRVFSRRLELPTHLPIVFIADRDLWVIGGVPADYETNEIILTDGYSIENDAIRDIRVMDLLDEVERSRFDIELEQICKWFAVHAMNILRGGDGRLNSHPDEIFRNMASLNSAAQTVESDPDINELYIRIFGESAKLLRGKTLMALLMRQLSYSGRSARHRHDALLDQAGANPGPLLTSIFDAVRTRLGIIQDTTSIA